LNYHDESDSMADFIEGKRPVIEALRTHVPLKCILMADNLSQGDSLVRDIQRKAKNLDVSIKKVSKKKLDEISERGSHQGVMAETAPFNYVNVTTILDEAVGRGARRPRAHCGARPHHRRR
jgi:23S rRNA (guanosine2251-2'-O)-methyltransferase